MDDVSHPTTDALDQAEEDILTCALADEALEAAAGTKRKGRSPGSTLLLQTCRVTWC